MPDEVKDLYTPEEVAEILGVNKRTIYRHIRSGKIVAVQIGRFYRISYEELMRIIREGTREV